VSSELGTRPGRDCRKQTVTSSNFRTSVIAGGIARPGRLPSTVNNLLAVNAQVESLLAVLPKNLWLVCIFGICRVHLSRWTSQQLPKAHAVPLRLRKAHPASCRPMRRGYRPVV
jgi:hypothetical protein